MDKKGPLYQNGSSAERLFFVNKIPHRYWKAKPEKVDFSNVSYAPTGESKIRVSAEAQQNYYNQLVAATSSEKELHKFAGSFICISSVPSEEHSMQAGCALATSIIRSSPAVNVGIVDLSGFDPIDKSRYCDFVLIHNVTSDSTRDRIQYARDYINWATRNAVCVLCTSGKNPLEMCYEVLRKPANMVLYCDERSSKRSFDY